MLLLLVGFLSIEVKAGMDEVLSLDEWRTSANDILEDDAVVDVNTCSIDPPSSNSSSTQVVSVMNMRGRYKSYSWAFKRYAVETALSIGTVSSAAQHLNIPRQTLEDWMNRKGFDPDSPVPSKRQRAYGGGRVMKLPSHVEEQIADTVRLLRSRLSRSGSIKRRVRVSVRILQSLAIGFATQAGVYSFSASKRWVKNFGLRNGFRYKTQKTKKGNIHKRDACVDIPLYLNGLALAHAEHVFQPRDIISIDEFSVVFDSDLSKTMVDMRTDDRGVDPVAVSSFHVTAVAAANAAGEWERLMIIFQGKGKRVREVRVPFEFRASTMIRFTPSGFINHELYAEFMDAVLLDHAGRPCLISHDAYRSVHLHPLVQQVIRRYDCHEIVVPAYWTSKLGALDLKAFACLQTELIVRYDAWALGIETQLSAPDWRDSISSLFFESRSRVSSRAIREGFYMAALISDPSLSAFRPVIVDGTEYRIPIINNVPHCNCSLAHSPSFSSSSSSSLSSSSSMSQAVSTSSLSSVSSSSTTSSTSKCKSSRRKRKRTTKSPSPPSVATDTVVSSRHSSRTHTLSAAALESIASEADVRDDHILNL